MAHHDEPVKSTASIGGHPIHPMLIPFPIAFLVAVLVTDISFITTGDTFWSRASLWLLAAGVATALFAAIFGATDFLTLRRVREHKIAWWHMGLNLTAVVLAAINLIMRVMNAEQVILPLGVILSAAVVGILTVSGWLGGELSYKHKIGVYNPADQMSAGAEEEEMAHRRAYGAGD
jgi:uncharacterized membrane protein